MNKLELKSEIAKIVKPGMSTTEIFNAAIESNNPTKTTMKKLENLTKENFWNDLQAKYPKGMKVFCDWIDEYKKANDWNMLFNSDSEYQNAAGKNAPAPKYHDLPLSMQMGIWIEFVVDRGGCEFEIEDMFKFDLREEITEYIIMLEAE